MERNIFFLQFHKIMHRAFGLYTIFKFVCTITCILHDWVASVLCRTLSSCFGLSVESQRGFRFFEWSWSRLRVLMAARQHGRVRHSGIRPIVLVPGFNTTTTTTIITTRTIGHHCNNNERKDQGKGMMEKQDNPAGWGQFYSFVYYLFTFRKVVRAVILLWYPRCNCSFCCGRRERAGRSEGNGEG